MLLIKDFEVRTLPDKGKGVFATRDIPAGTIIGDYLGMIVPNEDVHEEEQGLYAMLLNDQLSILANPTESGIHLINHSCEPNCGMYPLGDHTVYFARRKIFRGEELAVSYTIGQPDEECNPCRHICMCGFPSCRGSLHCSDPELNAFFAFERAALAKQKGRYGRYIFEVGKKLEPLASYPKNINDHEIYQLFAVRGKPAYKLTGKPTLAAIRACIRQEGRPCKIPARGITVLAIVGKELRVIVSS
ncbi:MAG: SET domain-containing protein [Patescibacteria group bacterium]